MALERSYETKLLRLLIGLVHVSVVEQLSLTRHAKPFHTLTPEQKQALQEELATGALAIAEQLNEAALSGGVPLCSPISFAQQIP